MYEVHVCAFTLSHRFLLENRVNESLSEVGGFQPFWKRNQDFITIVGVYELRWFALRQVEILSQWG